MKYHRHHRSSPGFSLVVTLTLMILLTLIGVGMLSLSAITLRTTGATKLQATAQANARLALILAIGQLQEHAGPDQRVTASAAITGVSQNPNWTGVWSTTVVDQPTLPMISGHTDRRRGAPFLTDLRSSNPQLANKVWREQLRLAWLVSGENPAPGAVNPMPIPPVGTGSPSAIQLVGPGTVGEGAPATERVAAPYVELREGARTTGGFAWWVGDESLKARIDLTTPQGDRQPSPENPDDGGIFRLAGAGGPGIRDVQTPDGSRPYTAVAELAAADRAKLLSLTTAGAAVGDLRASNGFHHLTTHSQGLLVDVVTGSLKKDLTSYLERSRGAPPVAGVRGTGLASDAPLLPAANYRTSGPQFAQLRNWYQLRQRVQGALANPVIDQPLTVAMRGGITNNSHYNLSAPLPDVTASSQALQPVLVDSRVAFDFSLDVTDARAGGRGIRIHLYPRITLWNPYNITIRGQRYFVGTNLPNVNNLSIGGGSAETIPGTGGEMYPGLAPSGTNGHMIYFALAPIDLGPGEALVFSPDVSASRSGRLSNNSAAYNPDNISANVLSAAIPGGTNNFNLSTNRQVPQSVNLASRPNYAFSGGVNQAFDNAPTMMLKQLRSSGSWVSLANLNSTAAETLQLVHFGHNGTRSCWWWYLFGAAMDPVNGGTGFESYTANPNRYPPRLWAVQTRLRWLDEADEQAAVGITHGGSGGALFYNNPVIGNFNVRAPMTFRDAFSYYAGWTKYAPGGFMIPWSTPRLNDSRMSIPFRNGKAHGSPFSPPRDLSGPFAMFEVPRPGLPIFSLAAFQHAQLGYHSWQPTYAVGHSIAEPRADRNATVNSEFLSAGETAWGSDMSRSNQRPGRWEGLVQNLQNETLVHDLAFGANQQLWDRFFLSTMPHTSGSAAWDPLAQSLPNSNLRLIQPALDSASRGLLTGTNSFDHAAAFLANLGAFNVNSTSVEAWRAMFSSLNEVPRPTLAGSAKPNTFSRLLLPLSAEDPTARAAAGTWRGARTLSSAEIDSLAKTMVAVVRERGPFVSMADFVNRRLQAPGSNDSNDPSLSGPLQAAIERAGLNSRLQNPNRGDLSSNDSGGANGAINEGAMRPDWNAFYPFKNYGAPGYLTQADVLQTIGHQLTVRGDTFVIRAYGDARDASGRSVARAWCEAVVQRLPEYVAPSPAGAPSSSSGNSPLEPAVIPSATGFMYTINNALLPVNRKHGRRFAVIGFRWLNPSEV
jgi:hypothetical protein